MALITTQSKPFMQLVDLQQKSLNTLNTIRDTVTAASQQNTADTQNLQLIAIQKLLDVQKNSLALNRKVADRQLKDMSDLSKSMKNWKTWGDKIKDVTRSVSDSMNPTALSKKLFGAFNVGGIFNKKIAALDYVQKRQAVGDKGEDLKDRGKQYASALYSGLRAQNNIDRMKSQGATDADIASGTKGRRAQRLIANAQREMDALNNPTDASTGKSAKDAANPMGGNTAGKSVPITYSDATNKMGGNPSTDNPLKDAQAAHETQVETLRQNQLQTDLLSQIVANTAGLAGPGGSSAAGGKEDKKSGGGRMLDGFSSSVKGIGDAVGSLGSGIGKGVGGLIGGVILGIMQGIADGIASFGKAKVLKGVAVMGLLTAALWGMTSVLDDFSQLDFGAITIGAVAVGAIALAVAGLGKGAGAMVKGILVLLGLSAGIWALGKAFNAVSDAFNGFVDGITRLNDIGFDGLAGTAAGIVALAGAIGMFGAGAAAAGLGTLIGNLLTIGQDSPLDQLQKLADMGDSLNNAANGVQNIAAAMQSFSGLDNQTLKSLNDFPWKSMAVFVAAGGVMSANGAKVYQASKGNADGQAQVNAQNAGGAATNNVSTAVQNNTTNNQVIKLPSRNNESSYSSYARARYA